MNIKNYFIVITVYYFNPDQPATPILTSNIREPTDGDVITLTCVTLTSGVTSYKFYKDNNQKPLPSTGNMNTYTITNASLGNENGAYTCVALYESVSSDNSSALSIRGESNLKI